MKKKILSLLLAAVCLGNVSLAAVFAEGTADTETVYSLGEKELTVADVIAFSNMNRVLQWADFKDYNGEIINLENKLWETEWQFAVADGEDGLMLRLCGSRDKFPDHVYLSDSSKRQIDIRNDDVQSFLNKGAGEDSLTISEDIKEHFRIYETYSDESTKPKRRLVQDFKSIMRYYNVPLRGAFTEFDNIDDVLASAYALKKYYVVEYEDGSVKSYNEHFQEMKSSSYTIRNGEQVALPYLTIPENAWNAFYNSDFAKTYIAPDAQVENVYWLSGESSMMGTAIYYRTSVGDYVYYYYHTIGETLFPVSDFCAYQQAIKDENAKYPESGGGINIADVWDLTDYRLKANISNTTGDVNNDGTFNISDVVLLQKWLLAVPDTHLANWKAVDFCEDNKLDVFDLCLMKRALIEKMNDEPQNVDTTFKFQGVTDVRYNDNNHTKWTGFVARSENDLIDIITENEGISADKASIEGIDSNTFKDKSIVIVYSICTAGNSYSIIDNISVKGTSIDVSTISKKPMVPTPDMLFRRYVYVIDKNAVTNADSFNFTDESSYYQYDEKNEAVAWFKKNGDIAGNNDGITNADALAVQKKLLGLDKTDVQSIDSSLIANKVFVYEKSADPGIYDDLCDLSFGSNGTYSYNIGYYRSSNQDQGTWTISGDTLVLTGQYGTNKFRYDDKALVYIAEGSDGFSDFNDKSTPKDGEKFYLAEEPDYATINNLPEIVTIKSDYNPIMSDWSGIGILLEFDSKDYSISLRTDDGHFTTWDIAKGSGPIKNAGVTYDIGNSGYIFWTPDGFEFDADYQNEIVIIGEKDGKSVKLGSIIVTPSNNHTLTAALK